MNQNGSSNSSRRRCPQCGKAYSYVSISDWKPYPFCSERCRIFDLESWLDEDYRIVEDISADFETTDF